MTDLLISILIVGTATAYVIEFLNLVTMDFFGVGALNKFLTLPLSGLGLWLLDAPTRYIAVAIPAAAFIAAWISKQLNKPVVTNLPRLRNL
jgi:hypothetical protein